MYRLVPPYPGVQDFLVLPCTALYRLVSRRGQGGMRENQNLRNMLVCTSTYFDILVCTNSYQSCKVVHTVTYINQSVCTSTYQYRQVHTSSYWHKPIHTCIYWLVLVCTSTYQKFLDSKKLQTRFEPVIFCILFVYFTAALRVHSEQIPGICLVN